jgi:hypothetical protein
MSRAADLTRLRVTGDVRPAGEDVPQLRVVHAASRARRPRSAVVTRLRSSRPGRRRGNGQDRRRGASTCAPDRSVRSPRVPGRLLPADVSRRAELGPEAREGGPAPPPHDQVRRARAHRDAPRSRSVVMARSGRPPNLRAEAPTRATDQVPNGIHLARRRRDPERSAPRSVQAEPLHNPTAPRPHAGEGPVFSLRP